MFNLIKTILLPWQVSPRDTPAIWYASLFTAFNCNNQFENVQKVNF